MDGARDQFLARSALATDQHGRLGRGNLADQGKYLLHSGTRRHQIHQHALIRKLPLQAFGFFFQPALIGGALQKDFEGAGLNRFFEEPKRSQIVNRLDGGLDISECGQNNGRRSVALGLQTFQEFKPVHAGHHQIGYQDVDWGLGQLFERFLAVRRSFHGIAPGLDHFG